jgi:hypothetical protein
MYDNIKRGDQVVFKEGRLFDWCTVKEVSYTDNNGNGKLQNFELLSKTSGKSFNVSVCEGGAYCPWRFVPASELTNYNR